MSDIAVLSFYSFVKISNLEVLLPQILQIAGRKYVKGTVLIAEEGFNGSISGQKEAVLYVLDSIIKWTGAQSTISKINYCTKQPFSRIKVKIKNEIVAMKAGEIDVDQLRGTYINSQEWDKYMTMNDTILVDVRNDYEVKAGHFENTLNPNIDSFRDFPQWVEQNKDLFTDKKILMYCTGGIRCEKSTAYMKKLGYRDVYHLEGGILQYLEDTKNSSGKWKGECFVFDDRGAVDDNLSPAQGYWVQRGENAKSTTIKLHENK